MVCTNSSTTTTPVSQLQRAVQAINYSQMIDSFSVSFADVQMVKGFANVFAGGEGLFMTTLTGPGVVWLQGETFWVGESPELSSE